MKISQPQITQKEQEIVYSVEVDFSLGNQTLQYSLDAEYADLISSRSDAALACLLIPAMTHGEDIYISGTISEKLYYNLSGTYQKILKKILPTLQIINIYADDIQPASGNPKGVATGFSAGIDSYCVLADHYYQKYTAPGFKVTHLLYNNVGSHGGGGESLFKKRYQILKPFVTEKIGLPFLAISSNLSIFYRQYSFKQTHTPRNASVAFLLQNGIKNYIYASAYSYEDVFLGSEKDGNLASMGYSDLVTLPLLSTETLNAFSAGSEYTRVDKTIKVAQIEDSYKTLDVCVNDNIVENCSTCGKCMRTLLTLEIAGLIDKYRDAFDLELYYKNKNQYIVKEVISSKDPLTKEIRNFARDKDFKIPISTRLVWLKTKITQKITTKFRNAIHKISKLKK